MLCALGTPCLYYGTEQGLEGNDEPNDSGGIDDWRVRESLFNPDDQTSNILNSDSIIYIYKGIAKVAQVRKALAPLRFGRMYILQGFE